MEETKYKMRVVRGAFIDQNILNTLGARVIEKFKNDPWVSLDEVLATLEQIKDLQKAMVRHYVDQNVPWYMDGYEEKDANKLIVAFGVDDGAGGRIFQFDRNDKVKIKEVVNYGISKGIPKEQMDFYKTGWRHWIGRLIKYLR